MVSYAPRRVLQFLGPRIYMLRVLLVRMYVRMYLLVYVHAGYITYLPVSAITQIVPIVGLNCGPTVATTPCTTAIQQQDSGAVRSQLARPAASRRRGWGWPAGEKKEKEVAWVVGIDRWVGVYTHGPLGFIRPFRTVFVWCFWARRNDKRPKKTR
jgi:hypothetical protein